MDTGTSSGKARREPIIAEQLKIFLPLNCCCERALPSSTVAPAFRDCCPQVCRQGFFRLWPKQDKGALLMLCPGMSSSSCEHTGPHSDSRLWGLGGGEAEAEEEVAVSGHTLEKWIKVGL
jgi:hypothetical protein